MNHRDNGFFIHRSSQDKSAADQSERFYGIRVMKNPEVMKNPTQYLYVDPNQGEKSVLIRITV